MNNVLLKQFYDNTPLRDAVKAFLIESLREHAATLAFDGESTTGIRDANAAVDKSFDKLQQFYGKIKASPIPNSR